MLFLIFAWEERVADVQLIEDATKTPHVDGCVVRDAEHDLRCSVESRLDVGVDLLVFETARAEIDNLDSRLVDLSKQNVLGLEIAVDDVVLPHVV